MPMDYDDNDFHIQNLHLAGEGSSTVSPALRPYALPKFDYDDSLRGNLRFDSLVENEVFLGITGQEDNQWIEEYSRGSSGIEFSSSAAESRRNNVWSEATSSESVEMLLKSVGQEEGVVGETIADELDASDEPSCLATIMDPNLKQDDGKDHIIHAQKVMVPNKPLDNFSDFSASFDCEKSHITSTSQSQEAQISGGELDSVVLGKNCNLSEERVDRICGDVNQEAEKSAFELVKKESGDNLSTSKVECGDTDFTQNFSASKTGDLTKKSSSSEASSVKNKETSVDDPTGSDIAVETLTYSAKKPSVLSNVESLDRPSIEASIPVVESASMHEDSLATPPIAGFVNVQATEDDNKKSEVLATRDSNVSSPLKLSDVQSHSVVETENDDARDSPQATSDAFEVSVGTDPSEMREGSSINNLGTNLTNEFPSAEFHAGSTINKDLVACSKTPKAQSGDLNKNKSLTAKLSGSVLVNDEIQSSEQGGMCDEDVTFNEGGDVRLPSDSLDQKNVESTLSAEGCKKTFVMDQGSGDDMIILAEPGAAVKSDSVSSPDTPDGVHLLSGSIATDYIDTKSPIHGVSSVHHDNEEKKETGILGDGSSRDESPKVASMIDCAAEESLPIVEKCASPDCDGNVVHGMAGQRAPPVENLHAIISERTQEAKPDGLGCSTTSVTSSLPFDSSAKVGDSVESGGLQDPKESMSGYHRAAPLSLAVNMSAEQQISTDVVPPSEYDASHKRHNEDSSASVDKPQSISPSNTTNTELLRSTKVTHEMVEVAIYKNASPLEVTEDMKGKMQSVSSNINTTRDKSFTFEVTTTAGLEQTDKGRQSFPAIQACNMSTNMEGSSINSSSSILDAKKPEAVQNPVSATIQVGAKGNSERKTRRKSVGKESAKNSNRLKETTPRQSRRVEKSSVQLTSSATGHPIQFEELKPQEKIECSIKKPSGVLPIPTSNLPDLNNSTAIFQQPFTDNQQVQLRAQILVYGSLISGSPPEEPHMIAAFGQSDGGRETWEGAWHACLQRVHGKKSQANNPSTLMQSRSDLKDVGYRTPDPGIKHSSFPSKILSSPIGGASNKGTPSPVVSPLIPLSSPLWNISTPSSVGFPSSSMPRTALQDYRPSFSPLNPYQVPPVQNSSGHNPPWLSQGPFAGQWVASSPVAAFNASARFSALPITEAVKLAPAKVSGGSGIKHTYSIPVVHSAGPSVFSGASSLSDAKKPIVSSGQASSDSKSRKRKKVAASLADQTSVPTQALLASVTAPPVASLHQVTHSEGYNRAPSLAENQTVSIKAPVVSSIFSTSVTVSTPASIKSKSSPGRFPSVLSTHEHPRFRDKMVENVGISEETLNKVEECKLQAEDTGVHTSAAAVKTGQSSSDSKTLKKKKVTTGLDVNQASVPRQAPVASVTGPVIGYLPHLFRTEGHSQILLFAPNQTDSVTAPVVCSPFPTSIAMSTPLAITSKSSSGRFPKDVYPASSHGYPKPVYQNMEKAVAAEETLSRVKESKLLAENAALLAAAEVSHCQGVWSRLEKQRRSGVVSDDEVNLMSSTVSVAAAAIAKMAAAAAKIASDVAEQARLMADEVFLSRKTENFDQSSSISHPNVIKDTPASLLKSMDKSNHPNSIISAAREAARRRIQAASAASKHAENLDAIVKAAELAAEAVSQAGKIVAMGDLSDLRELVEAGPEGYFKTSQLAHDQQGDVSGHLNSITDRKKVEAAPNMCTKEIHTLKRGLAIQEPSVHLAAKQMMVIDGLSGSTTGNERDTSIPRAHKGSNLSKAVGVAPETDTRSLHATDVSQNMPQSTSGAWEEHNIKEGCLVEVYKDDGKYKGAWLTAKVLSLKDEKALLCYSEVQSSDEGSEKLKEWVPLEVEGNKVPRVRIARPMTTMGFEGTRKRRRTAVTDYSWSNGDRVDVWVQDCIREGVVMEPNKIDLTSIAVQFPALGETLVVRSWHVRPALIWKDKKWIEWSSLKGGHASEGETPKEKRMKLGSPVKDKGKAKNVDLVESGRHEELGTLPLSTQESSFNVGKSTRDENKLRTIKEGARVIFGVPKPGKKQKFMDVSKHYVADGSKKNNTANDPIKFARYLKPPARNDGWKLNSRNEVAETKSRLIKSRKPPVPSFRTLIQKDNNPKSTTRDSEMTDKSDSDVEKKTEFVSSKSSNTKGPAFSFTSIPKSEHLNKGKLVIEPRRSNRKIQPTSRLLEGLQSSLTISKIPSVSHASQRSHNKVISRGNTSSNDG